MSPPLLQVLREWMCATMRHSMRGFLLFAKEHNYSVEQLNVIFRIQHKGACGVSELADEMGVTRAAASQLLQRLVQQGVVERSEDPRDRRNRRMALTEAGREVAQRSMQARQNWLYELSERLSAEEQDQVAEALQVLVERAAELDAAPK